MTSVDGPDQHPLRTLTYGGDGRVIAVTDATGATTKIQSLVADKSEIETSPTGRLSTTSTFDDAGRLATEESTYDGRSEVTTHGYDSESRQISLKSPSGATQHWTYDAHGNVKTFTAPNGGTWTFTPNTFGEVTQTVAPDRTIVQSAVYDANGNLLSESNAGAGTITYTYGPSGLVRSSTDDRGTTVYDYDDDARPITVTDPAHRQTSFTYDADGRIKTTTATDGGDTSFNYGDRGELRSIVDPEGGHRDYDYDALGYLDFEKDPAGRVTTYVNDREGHHRTINDAAGGVTTWAYDPDGHLNAIQYPDHSAVAIDNDGLGRPRRFTNDDDVVEQGYDPDGNLRQTRSYGAPGSSMPDVTFILDHDVDGNLTDISGPAGHTVYTYDQRDLLKTITSPSGHAFSFVQRDDAGRPTELDRPNGVNDHLGYSSSTLVSRIATRGTTIVARADSAIDELRRRTGVTDDDGTSQLDHDAGDRLISATHPPASGLADESFAYDRIGNRTSWNGSPAADVSYGPGSVLRSDGAFDYAYDALGRVQRRTNRATRATTTYHWNGAGQLDSVTQPDGTRTNYRYDALGRRVETASGGAVHHYAYVGWNVQLAYDGNRLASSYTTGTYPGDVYEIDRGSTALYPMVDQRDSVTGLTDATGAVVGRNRYSAFGTLRVTGLSDDAYTFTGDQHDQESGLYYARSRYYDPAVGRFLSPDPEPTLNPYAYAAGRPYDLVDPLGRAATSERLELECKPGWSLSQKAAALKKAFALQKLAKSGKLKVVLDFTRNPAFTRYYRGAVGLGQGLDADHIIELVLGGEDSPINMWPLDSSVNRSFGAQIGNFVRGRDGQIIRKVATKGC